MRDIKRLAYVNNLLLTYSTIQEDSWNYLKYIFILILNKIRSMELTTERGSDSNHTALTFRTVLEENMYPWNSFTFSLKFNLIVMMITNNYNTDKLLKVKQIHRHYKMSTPRKRTEIGTLHCAALRSGYFSSDGLFFQFAKYPWRYGEVHVWTKGQQKFILHMSYQIMFFSRRALVMWAARARGREKTSPGEGLVLHIR